MTDTTTKTDAPPKPDPFTEALDDAFHQVVRMLDTPQGKAVIHGFEALTLNLAARVAISFFSPAGLIVTPLAAALVGYVERKTDEALDNMMKVHGLASQPAAGQE